MLILSLAASLALPPVGPPSASVIAIASPSPSPSPSSRELSLRIDDRALLDRESAAVVEHTVFFVREDAVKALGQGHHVTVVDDPRAATILVTLSWVSYDDSIYGVSVHT